MYINPFSRFGTIAVTLRSGISKRSHEKIGDCEQSRYVPPQREGVLPGGVLQISRDRDDQLGLKIKIEKNP